MSGVGQLVFMNQRSFALPIVSIDTFFNDMCNYLDDYMSEYRNPSFYSYTLDGNATYINDGGGDMYDSGNYTYPWFLSNTQYTSASGPLTTALSYSVVTPTTVDTSFVYRSLGYTGQLPLTILGYRTGSNTVIGLQKSGDSGADGGGTLSSQLIYNGTTINTFTVYAFYRETYNAGDPSHCDLYMLIGHPNWDSTFGSINTYADPVASGGNGGYLYASSSSNVIAVTTLLSKASGVLVTSEECQTVVQAFTSRMRTYLGY